MKKILVIKMRHHGDVLLTSPVFSTLKDTYPEARIDAYIYKDTLPLLEGHPAISHYHLYDRSWKKLSFFKKIYHEIKILLAIRKQKYDLIINLTEGDRGAIAAYIGRAKTRVGVDPGKTGMWRKRKLYTHLSEFCPTPRHAVERNLDVLRSIGIQPTTKELSLHISEETKADMTQLLSEHSVTLGDYILIHPTSRWMFKCPPPRLFSQLISRLLENGDKIVLTAAPDPVEKKYIRDILKNVGKDDNLINLAGRLTIKELAFLISKARFLYSVDSLPMHIGSCFKTPLAVLFGPSSEKEWGPWQHPEGHVITSSDICRPCNLAGCGNGRVSDCLSRINVDQLLIPTQLSSSVSS